MRIFIFLCFLVFGFSNIVFAGDVDAVRMAAKGNYNGNPSTSVGRSLVQWYKLHETNRGGFREAASFINTHKNWPDIDDIRKNAENNLSSSVSASEVISFFNGNEPLTSKGMTYYLNALIAGGQTTKALQILKKWYPEALMGPDDQSRFIANFGKYLGSQDHERRLRSIIHEGHYSSSRSIAKLLGNGYPQLVEAKIGLIESKPNVNQLINAVPVNLRNNEALLLARAQWRRKNDEDSGAIDILRRAPNTNLTNHAAWWKERHIMARRLMEQRKWGSAYDLVKNHGQIEGVSLAEAEFLAGWLALRKLGKPWEAFKHFEKLFNSVESPISRARGAYWSGLASDALKHPEIAVQWYQVAAKYQTTFYGQMAAQKINLPLALLQATPIQVTADARQRFKMNSAISAALILQQAGQRKDMRLFLLSFANEANSGLDFKLGAELASSLGQKDIAVKIAKTAERKNFLMPEYLFPVLPEVKKGGFAVHPSLMLGIIRQESAFDPNAESVVGALGLMQLMPATAKETAQKMNMSYSKDRLTSDTTYNMKLGSFYLNQMLKRYDGNRSLAFAAYNAGPGRVSQWIKEFGDPRDPTINETDWIETIPVAETRNYVHRVTEASNVYARMLK